VNKFYFVKSSKFPLDTKFPQAQTSFKENRRPAAGCWFSKNQERFYE